MVVWHKPRTPLGDVVGLGAITHFAMKRLASRYPFEIPNLNEIGNKAVAGILRWFSLTVPKENREDVNLEWDLGKSGVRVGINPEKSRLLEKLGLQFDLVTSSL